MISDQAVQKMTEHNFSYVWIKKIFVPSQFSWFLNLYFLDCPCNSRSYVHFVLIPFVCQKSLCHLVFLPAPTVTLCSEHSACSCNETSILSTNSREPFLTRQTMIPSNIIFLTLFIVFFYPFLQFVCSFFLVDCCDLWAHVRFVWGSRPCTIL